MNRGRRKSVRLTETPWVFNWPKKPLVYVNLLDQHEGANQQGSVVISETSLSNNRRSIVTDALDVKNERNKGKMVKDTMSSDEDNDFVTLGEFFGHSAKFLDAGSNLNKSNPRSTRTSNKPGLLELGTKKRKRCIRDEGIHTEQLDISDVRVQRKSEPSGRRGTNKIKDDDQPRGRKLALKKNPNTVRPVAKVGKQTSNKKGKKVRTYEGYIQKKFSPSIMTDVLLNLSEVQSK